jgi:hypothetical protein
MAGTYAAYNFLGRLCHNPETFPLPACFIGVMSAVPQAKQFRLRIARRPGLAGEIASALWQKGVRIRAFSADLQEGQDVFHLAVDKAAVARRTFIENGWNATEEGRSPS